MVPLLSRRSLLGGLAVGGAALATGCAGTVTRPGDLSRLRIMAPAATGGGWDETSRVMQQVLQSEGLTRNVQVFNVEGAGGVIGLGQLSRESDDALLMTMGLVMVGAIATNDSPVALADVTPIARITGESEIMVVPGDSEFDTIADFVEAWAQDTRGLPVAGGSAGGTDQILAGLVAQATGVDARQINYIAYSGGGESVAALLGGQVAVGISGINEYAALVQNGDLKGLAVSGTERVESVPDVPTLQESDIDVELSNWRGFMARPGMSDNARGDLIDLVVQARDTEAWAEELDNKGWDDELLTGEEYGAFLEDERERVDTILTEIGLIG